MLSAFVVTGGVHAAELALKRDLDRVADQWTLTSLRS